MRGGGLLLIPNQAGSFQVSVPPERTSHLKRYNASSITAVGFPSWQAGRSTWQISVSSPQSESVDCAPSRGAAHAAGASGEGQGVLVRHRSHRHGPAAVQHGPHRDEHSHPAHRQGVRLGSQHAGAPPFHTPGAALSLMWRSRH